MDFTRFTNVSVAGTLHAGESVADKLSAGQIFGTQKCSRISIAQQSYTATEENRMALVISASSASTAALVLGGSDADVFLFCNTNAEDAITVKNLETDSGTSVAAGKTALILCSDVANQTKIIVLD